MQSKRLIEVLLVTMLTLTACGNRQNTKTATQHSSQAASSRKAKQQAHAKSVSQSKASSQREASSRAKASSEEKAQATSISMAKAASASSSQAAVQASASSASVAAASSSSQEAAASANSQTNAAEATNSAGSSISMDENTLTGFLNKYGESPALYKMEHDGMSKLKALQSTPDDMKTSGEKQTQYRLEHGLNP